VFEQLNYTTQLIIIIIICIRFRRHTVLESESDKLMVVSWKVLIEWNVIRYWWGGCSDAARTKGSFNSVEQVTDIQLQIKCYKKLAVSIMSVGVH